MKKYIKPEMNVVNVQLTNALLGLSDKTLGEGFDSGDVSYTHEDAGWDIWQGDDFDEDY